MRGRKPVSEKAMPNSERQRLYRLRKKQRAGVRPAGYQEYKAGVLKQFAELVELFARRHKVRITQIASELNLEDTEWRALRAGQKGRILPERFSVLLQEARLKGWASESRIKKIGNLTIIEKVRPLWGKREWEKQERAWRELESRRLEDECE